MMTAAEAAGAVSDDAFKAWGIEFMTEVCRKLVDGGACGLHFYTLNLEKATLPIPTNLS